MSGPLASLADRWKFNDRLLATETEGFSVSDWRHRPEGGGNSATWILGHVAATRRGHLRSLGVEVEVAPWEERFERGKPCVDASAYPPPADLARDFGATGAKLFARLAAMSAAEADAPAARPMPDGSSTVGGVSGFLYFHETYHLGQIGYIRRMRGHKGFA